MNSTEERWAGRALKHARVLSKGIGARGATSAEEGRAAEYVRDELLGLGLSNVRLEPFQGAASAWLPWSAGFSIAVWAVLIGLLFGPIGGVIAALLYLVSAWTIYRELYPSACSARGLSASGYPVRRWLWRGSSQNVVGVVPAVGEAKRSVVLLSYLDSAHASFFWRNERRQWFFSCLVSFLFLSLLGSATAFVLGAVTAEFLFYVIALLLLFPQIAALLLGIRSERSPVGLGANNNASGIGTVLALAERLKETPLANNEVLLLATGCRETGGDGLRSFCDRHQAMLADCTFVAVEGVGVGDQVVYLTGEGLLRTTSYSPETLAIAERAAKHCQENGIVVNAERHRGRATEMGIIARSGLRGLSINIWPDDSASVTGQRDADDTIDTLQKQALSRAHTFAWALLQEIDTQH